MNWLMTIGAFLKGLFAGLRARNAARAGSELVDGKRQIDAVDKDVADIEAELARARLTEPPSTPPSTPTTPATPPTVPVQ